MDLLTSAKITVITASRRQVTDPEKLYELVLALSKLLNKRLTIPEEKFKDRHNMLREQLLHKNFV